MGLSDADVGLAPQQAVPQILPGANQPLPSQATPNIGKQTGQVGLSDDEVGLGQQPSTLGDVAKSTGIGLAKGAIGLAGLPGDITSLVTGGAHGGGFGSEAIQHGIEGYTGKFYEPQTTAGKYAETIGSFAPAAVLPAGELGIGARLLRMVAAPAIASEAAGQLTEGTAAEPYARAGAAILGGGFGAGVRSRAAAPALLDAEGVRAAGSALYQSPDIANVTFHPQAINDLQDAIRTSLGNINDRLAPTTHALIDSLDTPINKSGFKIEDLDTARKLLGKEAGNFANPVGQEAAGRARNAIDSFLENVPQSSLISGDAQAANTALRAARANWAAQAADNLLGGKVDAAELSAGAANSGFNFENNLRQRIKGILLSPKQTAQFAQYPGVLDAMNDVVRGGTSQNLLRILGNYMGGGGGLGGLMAGGAGFLAGGPVGAFTAPLAGHGIKALGNRIMNNKVQAIRDAVLAKAPANAQAVAQRAKIAAQPNPGLDYQRALINAALSREPTQ